jgi:CSLREA domain-containing protein
VIHRIALGFALLAAAGPALAGTAGGSTITVSTAADEVNVDGLCSLREAITNANNNDQSGSTDCVAGVDPETIVLPAGNYALAIAGTGDDLNLSGDLDILGNLTLSGAGMQATVVDGQQLDRVFHVTGGSVTFRRLTVQGGASASLVNNGAAAGILGVAAGALVLDQVRVANNTATVGGGLAFGAAGVYGGASLSLLQSQIDHNALTYTGNNGAFAGGVYCTGSCTISDTLIGDNSAVATTTSFPGPMTAGGLVHCALSLTRSRLHGNQATSSGSAAGSLNNGCGGITVDISRTVFDGNSATMSANMGVAGGAIVNGGGGVTYNLVNLTIAGNTAHTGSSQNGYVGGGIVNAGGSTTFNLRQSTFSGNRSDGATTNTLALLGAGGAFKVANTLFDADTCSSTVTSLGGNLEGPGTSCGLSQVSDQSGVVARGVGLLADNGGQTMTLALEPTSPAVDRGDNGLCEAVDQRGVARPIDGNGDGTATCDVGAFEYSDVLFADGFE